MKKKTILYVSAVLIALTSFTACQDLFDLDSEQIIFTEDLNLDNPTDTVYSVIGILNSMQKIVDKTILLGEIRSDLSDLTPYASSELQEVANFTAGTKNPYNAPEDYYAVINNCNYFIANADTSLKKRNDPVFIKEYAVVKAYRAWTYLQLALNYGSVPFVLEPILTEKQTEVAYERKGVVEIANYFIDDLKPYIETPQPTYGSVGGYDSRKFFIPVRVLLGDLCLWAGRYTESATYYHDYLNDSRSPKTMSLSRILWSPNTNTFDDYPNNGYGGFSVGSSEIVTFVPMETTKFNGLVSDLRNVFNSTQDNDYYYQATYSGAYKELSQSQSYCKVYVNAITSTRDTLYAPAKNSLSDLLIGDLRLYSNYYHTTLSGSSLSNRSTDYQSINKISSQAWLYRKTYVFLRYAEAINRAGYPSAAFAMLKYGLTEGNLAKYVDSTEVKAGGSLLVWDKTYFTNNNFYGLHNMGSGNTEANENYVLPALFSKEDSIRYVEDKICDEMALETAFEGCRFYDLQRIALRRDDNAYLATKVAGRKGAAAFNQTLCDKLMNRQNWYLPLR